MNMNTEPAIVETSGRLDCDARQAWDKVCFYEHITIRPTLLLRIILPVPGRTSGCYQNVGDTSRCIYSDGGYLTKKITRIDEGECIEFDIIEQSIRYHRGIKLLGGTIQIVDHHDGTSAVRMLTRYNCLYKPGALAKFFVGIVVKMMHRIVIRDMQYCLAGSVTELQDENVSLAERNPELQLLDQQ